MKKGGQGINLDQWNKRSTWDREDISFQVNGIIPSILQMRKLRFNAYHPKAHTSHPLQHLYEEWRLAKSAWWSWKKNIDGKIKASSVWCVHVCVGKEWVCVGGWGVDVSVCYANNLAGNSVRSNTLIFPPFQYLFQLWKKGEVEEFRARLKSNPCWRYQNELFVNCGWQYSKKFWHNNSDIYHLRSECRQELQLYISERWSHRNKTKGWAPCLEVM